MGASIQVIPNANVQWQDALGAAQLTVPNLRFNNWTPKPAPVGTKRVNLATGLTYFFLERIDYTATFTMDAIPPAEEPLMHRLKLWLETGGQVTVNTQDSLLSSYTCAIAPGKEIDWQWDPANMWFKISMAVKNTLNAPLVCLYSTQTGVGYSLTVTPSSLVMLAGQTPVTLTGALVDAAGNPVSLPITWVSSAPSVAAVTVTGTDTAAVAAGSGTGNAVITASVGGLSVQVPVAVSVNNTPAAVTLTPNPLAFTATTYTGTPQVGVSGVPAQLVTATITNSQGEPLLYTPGMLAWTCNNAHFTLTDNLNGTCSVQPTAGAQSGVVTCKVVSNGVAGLATVTSVAGVSPPNGALVPQQSSVTLTAVGQQVSVPVTTIDQYGVAVA